MNRYDIVKTEYYTVVAASGVDALEAVMSGDGTYGVRLNDQELEIASVEAVEG